MEREDAVVVPDCGFKKMKVSSHRPWTEKSTHISTAHLLKHMGASTKTFFKLNRTFVIVFTAFIVLVLAATVFEFFTWRDTIFVFTVLFALSIGLIIRLAKNVIRMESLQVWFRDAYGLVVPYNEIVIALTSLYAGVDGYVLSNDGVVRKTDKGLIYEPEVTLELEPEEN